MFVLIPQDSNFQTQFEYSNLLYSLFRFEWLFILTRRLFYGSPGIQDLEMIFFASHLCLELYYLNSSLYLLCPSMLPDLRCLGFNCCLLVKSKSELKIETLNSFWNES